jgi:hypothetical protein
MIERLAPRAIDSGGNTPVDYRLNASRGVRPQVSLRASRQRPFLDRTLGLLKASARPGLSLFLADVVRLVSEPHVKLGTCRALDLDPNVPMTTTEAPVQRGVRPRVRERLEDLRGPNAWSAHRRMMAHDGDAAQDRERSTLCVPARRRYGRRSSNRSN